MSSSHEGHHAPVPEGRCRARPAVDNMVLVGRHGGAAHRESRLVLDWPGEVQRPISNGMASHLRDRSDVEALKLKHGQGDLWAHLPK